MRTPRSTPITLLLLALAAFAAPAALAAAQEQNAPTTAPARDGLGFPEETRFAFDLTQAEAWRDEMLPVVEQVSGRLFKRVPEIALVKRRVMGESLVNDQLALLKRLEPDETDENDRLELELDALLKAPALVGRFEQERERILLAAGNIRPLMQLGGTPADALGQIMQLIVAHELAHALHRQHVDVSRQLARVRTRDQALALEALSEGFAMLIQERVAEKLGMQLAQTQVVDLMSVRGVELEVASAAQRRYRETYEAGWRFFQAHDRAGTDGAPWSLLEAPPLTYGQIREPLRYGEPVAMEMSAQRLFRNVAALIGSGEWVRTVMTVDPHRVGKTFEPLGADVDREVAENVGPAYNLVLAQSSSTMPTLRTVSAIELSRPEFGPRLLELTGQLKDFQFERVRGLATGDAYTVDVAEPAEIPGLDATASRRFRLVVRQKQPPVTMVFVIAAAHRGRWAVQFTGNGTEIDDAVIARALTTVLERALADDGLVPVAWVNEEDPLVRALARLDEVMDDGPWTGDYRELTKSDLSAQLGADVQGLMALELGFVRGQVADFGRTAGEAALTSLLVELKEPDLAEGLAAALVTRSRVSLDQVSGIPGTTVETGADETRAIGDGIELHVLSGTITASGERIELSAYVARSGPFVAHVLDAGGVMGAERAERYVVLMLEAAARAE